MTFSAIHRALGLQPGPFTDEMIDAAIQAKIAEAADLDWKAKLLPERGLADTDFPKDVAAMANTGGGLIVYGVSERAKRAESRVGVPELTESYERSLRRAAVTAIYPPIFDLTVTSVGSGESNVVVIEIPQSVDGPHLVYKNEYFGAPRRNDADTEWMREGQIETMYRARFDARRNANEALDRLYTDAARGHDIGNRVWAVAVARPRTPQALKRVERHEAAAFFGAARELSNSLRKSYGFSPLQSADTQNPRPGLRRWVAPTSLSRVNDWRDAQASWHADGSVTLAAVVGGHEIGLREHRPSSHVEGTALEAVVAEVLALAKTAGDGYWPGAYEVRVGLHWTGAEPILILGRDHRGFVFDAWSREMESFSPVEAAIDVSGPEIAFRRQLFELARDCVNQGGITDVESILEPRNDEA